MNAKQKRVRNRKYKKLIHHLCHIMLEMLDDIHSEKLTINQAKKDINQACKLAK